VDSVEEVVALQAAFDAFQESLGTPTEDFNSLLTVSNAIAELGVTSNPYTPFTIQAISSRWKNVLDLIDVTDKRA